MHRPEEQPVYPGVSKNREAWISPFAGSVSPYDRDRNRGAGLPSGLSNDSYSRIVQGMNRRTAAAQPPPPAPVAPAPTRPMQRFASIADVTKAGFTRVASGLYKQGHDIWELRKADDGQYNLVRKREERAVDMRDLPAAAAGPGARRTAQLDLPPVEEELEAPPPPMDAELPGMGEELGAGSPELDYDLHEVMHGREPIFNPDAPEVIEMQQVVDMQQEPADAPGEAPPADGGEGGDDLAPTDDAPFEASAAWGLPREAQHELIGRKVLAIRKGGIGEGIILKILPMGDMMVDFEGAGEGEHTPLDMVLDPAISGCPMCGHDECPDCPEDCLCAGAMDAFEEPSDEDESEGEDKEAAVIIRVEDL